MSKPANFAELRRPIVAKGRDPHTVLLPEDQDTQNPESRYLVTFLADGEVEVVVHERNRTLFQEVHPDEAAAVAALDERTKPRVVSGPPLTQEQIDRSKARQEAGRQRVLAELAASPQRSQD